MESDALLKLSALSHPQRLALFRLLVRRFPDEVPAGEIAAALGYKTNTTSVYLGTLLNASLIRKRRKATSLLYQADLESTGDLLHYLFSDCCRDRIDLPHMRVGYEQCNRPASVLFACTGNSARSICAEVLAREILPPAMAVHSAGTDPAEAPNPLMLEVLREKGHEINGVTCKDITLYQQDEAPGMMAVITLCDRAANEDCPAWSGRPLNTHWGLEDPAEVQGSRAHRRAAFEHTYQTLQDKISRFAKLDLQSLPRPALQAALDQIGCAEPMKVTL
ncbi:arsenate reductase/protein-tyrosine-phosphatase family protein [Roseobacter weihaiensis]|uniref:arsenate reductase/protein-tyrosine-phosphatase family protein n=1 Tax=Roseobacter weihaiensis TaxID=2763262 RepID=UPI001D09C9E3|nr:helix-turn-helix domain-containing protein [Roseobacter sp. H9]